MWFLFPLKCILHTLYLESQSTTQNIDHISFIYSRNKVLFIQRQRHFPAVRSAIDKCPDHAQTDIHYIIFEYQNVSTIEHVLLLMHCCFLPAKKKKKRQPNYTNLTMQNSEALNAINVPNYRKITEWPKSRVNSLIMKKQKQKHVGYQITSCHRHI